MHNSIPDTKMSTQNSDQWQNLELFQFSAPCQAIVIDYCSNLANRDYKHDHDHQQVQNQKKHNHVHNKLIGVVDIQSFIFLIIFKIPLQCSFLPPPCTFPCPPAWAAPDLSGALCPWTGPAHCLPPILCLKTQPAVQCASTEISYQSPHTSVPL